MSEATRVYGIDLGTTYSCISYVDEHGKPCVVPNAEGQLTTPSVVYFESPDNIVVGNSAKEVASLYPDQVVSTVKRFMGDPTWSFAHGSREYTPQEISAFILRKLVADAEVQVGSKISDVVITCPAYFGLNQKEATKQAGQLADLNVRYVIPEPTAAAVAYGMEQASSEEKTVVVYDLGGGTFDVTVLTIKEKAIHVICTGGDHQLGGKDWDRAIATWFASQFSETCGVDIDRVLNDAETLQELLNAAETAKLALSSRATYKYRVQFEADRTTVELTRERFEELTADLLSRTMQLTDELLKVAESKGYGKVDTVLMVGGSTYMPHIMQAVKAKFSCDVRQFDPNQAVAKGAALFGFSCFLKESVKNHVAGNAGVTGTEVDLDEVEESERRAAEERVAQDVGMTPTALANLAGTKVGNVSSKSFGVQILGKDGRTLQINNLIRIHDAVPCSITRVYGTAENNRSAVTLRCFENVLDVGPDDRYLDLDTSTELGQVELRFSRPLPKGAPIAVTFELTEDGLLRLHGHDQTTDQEVRAEFRTAAVLAPDELETRREQNMAIAVH